MRNNVIDSLDHYVDQLNKNTYNDYNISDICFHDDSIYKRSCDIRVTCEKIFSKQRLTVKTMLIPLYKNTRERYYFNILRTITIIFLIYIESR